MVGPRYLSLARGGEGGVGRLRGDLDLLRLCEVLVRGRGERIVLAGVKFEVGTGRIGAKFFLPHNFSSVKLLANFAHVAPIQF